jgi:hypothetical protein
MEIPKNLGSKKLLFTRKENCFSFHSVLILKNHTKEAYVFTCITGGGRKKLAKETGIYYTKIILENIMEDCMCLSLYECYVVLIPQ